jgi:hypothetical protein
LLITKLEILTLIYDTLKLRLICRLLLILH